MDRAVMKKLISTREEETGHAVYGGSSLPRIIACPASVPESLMTGVGATSVYAAHGTMLHKMVEMVMNVPDRTLGESMLYGEFANKHKLNIADIYAVLDAVEFTDGIGELYEGSNPIILQESHTDCTTWGLPEVRGTCDYGYIGLTDADIIDFKFGQGVKVYAKDNTQGLSYAAGAVGFPSNVKNIHIHVVQPFLDHYDTWSITYEEMKEMMFGEITEKIENSKTPDPTYNPGEKQCRFCPSAFTCKARHSQALEDAATIFTAYEEIQTLGKEELSKVLDSAERYSSYIKQLRVFAQTECELGRGFPNHKMVAGRSLRAWIKPKDTMDYLRTMGVDEDKWYAKKFISPAQAEKLDRDFKKDESFKSLIHKPAGKPQFVKESDPRPALNPTAEATEAFADIE